MMDSEKDTEKNPYEWPVLTGQVPVSGNEPPPCPQHREVQHRDAKPPWCNRCGWRRGTTATSARKLGKPNGGWGTP